MFSHKKAFSTITVGMVRVMGMNTMGFGGEVRPEVRT